MTFVIKQPKTAEEFKQYYRLRWEILRAPWNQPEGTEKDDLEQQSIHVMAVSRNNSDNVIGVARLHYNSAAEAQVRYMAVSEKYQGKGTGSALLKRLEQHVINTPCKSIILDAREAAVGFYEKLGYNILQKSHLLYGEIQHYRMVKIL